MPRPTPRASLDWADIAVLEAAATRECQPEIDRALVLCDRWRERPGGLEAPSDQDWGRFRPLRLTREEDWSDWLAFILEKGPESMRRALLGAGTAPKSVRREVAAGGYRADVVLEFDSSSVSIEVKLDDRDLAKTFDCCSMLEAAETGRWAHFILLPEDRLDEWHSLVKRGPRAPDRVTPRTWTELALAIRRCLWRAEGTLAWRAWAVAYCGAIEQTILDLPCRDALTLETSHPLAAFSRAARLAAHLALGMEDDDADG